MPNSFIKAVSKQTGVKKGKLEHEYKKEEKIAKKKHISNPYAYATEVVERMYPGYKPKTEK